jgi:hypothetical protein
MAWQMVDACERADVGDVGVKDVVEGVGVDDVEEIR